MSFTVAIVGRPNVGESRATQSRSISIGRAGICTFTTPPHCAAARASRKSLEKLSIANTLNAIRFAEVVIVLIDAQAPFEE